MHFFNFFSLFLFVSSLFLLIKCKNSNSKTKKLLPGPWKLPLIGSMFHLLGGFPHHVLRDLAKKYGPIMHLQLGEVSLVVATSPDMAKQVLKAHDLAFASRPKLLAADILLKTSSMSTRTIGELGCEGLLVALLRLMKEGGLQFPITNDNIKVVIFGHGGNDEESKCTFQSSS